MNRTVKKVIPDSKNCSRTKNFTQIPNELLRNPEITAKAKTLLCLLLSNKWGWASHAVTLCSLMKEGQGAITNGLTELVEFGYLQRIPYKDTTTGKWSGSFWAYTDEPGEFDLVEVLKLLRENNYTPLLKPEDGKPGGGKPDPGKPGTRKLHPNNININNIKEKDYSSADLLKVRPHHFETFWSMYPKRKNGKGSKGEAQKLWNNICTRKTETPPRWRDVKLALHFQKKSIQWQDSLFIPTPKTWLNQKRWQDNPADLGNTKTSREQLSTSGEDQTAFYTEQLLEWFAGEQQRPPEESMLNDKFDPNQDRWRKWQMIPTAPEFLEKYQKWLSEITWLSQVTPNMFGPRSKVLGKFVQEYQKEIGFDLFTGRILT